MEKLPSFLKQYFWDVEFEKVDRKSYPLDILARILEYGDEKAIRWMKKNFTEENVADVLMHLRTVSPRSANYWALIFSIDRKKVLCLQERYLEIRRKHWPY